MEGLYAAADILPIAGKIDTRVGGRIMRKCLLRCTCIAKEGLACAAERMLRSGHGRSVLRLVVSRLVSAGAWSGLF